MLTYREKLVALVTPISQTIDLGGAGSGNFGHAGRPGEVGGSGSGDGGGASKSGSAVATRPTPTSTPQFKRWFKDSAVVDEDGDPLTVYHGTTHDISQFKEAGATGLNPESDWGAGVYFTSDPEDASENYAGEGPDLTNRLEYRVDQLQGEDEDLSREEALAQARGELAGKSPSIIPAYISMQKTFVVGEPNGSSHVNETRLEKEYEYADPDDPDSDIVGETGTLPDFIAALRDEASQYDGGSDAVDKFTEKVFDHDSITASKLVKIWKETEETNYIEGGDENQLVQSEVFRAALERAGFDGVVDRVVDEKFGSSRKYGPKMKGVNPDTTHFIAFTPTQIKSAIGNKAFDPENPDITLTYRQKLALLLGGEGSGNFGHSGRIGEVGGSGPSGGSVPKEPGTTPIPAGKIRGYHYTDNLDAIERDGLDVSKAKGSTYGEPNAIWFSTQKPSDQKDYVEVFLDPDEIAGGGPLTRLEPKDSAANRARIDEYNKGGNDFRVHPKAITPDRFVTTHRPWHDIYRYLAEHEDSRAAVLAGDHDAMLDDPDHASAINAIKAEYGKKKDLHFTDHRSRRLRWTDIIDSIDLGGSGSGNFGHAGRPGEIGGSGSGNGNGKDRTKTTGSDTGTGSGRGVAVSTPPAAGKTRPAPNPEAHHVANTYNESQGRPAVKHGYVQVDEQKAGAIADAYDALPDDDRDNPRVREAYAALSQEVQAQWDHITASGVTFTPWDKEGQPYQNAREMTEDVRANKHMFFFTGGEPHPLLGEKDPETGLSMNDKFRAVHDYFGHAAGGYGFGARGEENAWLSHSQMLTTPARRALTTETRGQNSWVNFGDQNYHPDGTHKNIPPQDRPFAKQKVALLSDEYVLMPGESALKLSYRADLASIAPLIEQLVLLLGGAGSGNFGHAGRIGEVGGSGSGEGSEPRQDEIHETRHAMDVFVRASTPGIAEPFEQNREGGDSPTHETRVVMKKQIQQQLSDDLEKHPAFAGQSRKEIEGDVRSTVDLWAETSGDNEQTAIMMQKAVQEEFGLDATMDHLGRGTGPPEDTRPPWIMSQPADAKDRAYVRAEYDRTQQWFKDRGMTHVTVMRGSGNSAEMEIGKQTITMQPASSWTTSMDVALKFWGHAGPPGSDQDEDDAAAHLPDPPKRVLLATRVPVSEVLSTSVTGRGSLLEQEVIVLGKPRRAVVLDADPSANPRSKLVLQVLK